MIDNSIKELHLPPTEVAMMNKTVMDNTVIEDSIVRIRDFAANLATMDHSTSDIRSLVGQIEKQISIITIELDRSPLMPTPTPTTN